MWTPFEFRQIARQWVEQCRAGAGDAAADDHDFGVDHIDQRRNAGGQSLHRCLPYLYRIRVARSEKVLCVLEAAVRSGGDRVVADGVFEAAGRVDDISCSVGIQRDVTQVTRAPDVPFEDSAV